MATLQDMSLEAKRNALIIKHILYGVLFFIYTLFLIILFDMQKDQIVFDGGYAYFFVIYFLLPHHAAYFMSLLFHLLAANLNKGWLIVFSILADLFSAIFLAYALVVVWTNPHQLTLWVLSCMLIPLILAIIALLQIGKQKWICYLKKS